MMTKLHEPTMRARFRLEAGKPVAAHETRYVSQTDPRANRPHYYIRLWIENAPKDAYAVTYTLHHTYYDPIRYNESPSENFSEEITSYGDFMVAAEIAATTKQRIRLDEQLSSMLEKTYASLMNESINKAILSIKHDGFPPVDTLQVPGTSD